MKTVYQLTFYHHVTPEWANNYPDGFRIGIFLTLEEAQAVEKRYQKEIHGFKDHVCEAEIIPIPVIGDSLAEKVFRFVGWNTDEGGGKAERIESDCYTSQSQAIAAMGEASRKTSRQDWALNCHTLGECHWQEGFTRYDSLITRNRCYTYFSIKGNFDPDAITTLLGLQPNQIWKIGDHRRDGSVYDFASWTFGKCSNYSPYVEEQMRITIAPLLGKIELLNQIRQTYDVSMSLVVVPEIYVGDTNPCLAPALDVIDFCYATRTEIDLDLYVMDSGED